MNELASVPYEARLSRLEQVQLERAKLDAEEQRLLAALSSDVPPWLSHGAEQEAVSKQWVREEVACALSLPSEVAGARIRNAVTLVSRLPATLALLESGVISFWHTLAMVDTITPLSGEIGAAVEERALRNAAGQSLGNFRRALRRAVKALDPANAQQRRERGMDDRRVGIRHDDDGMCTVWAYLPSEGGISLMNRLDAEAAGGDGDGRSADHRRADALIALANGHAGSGSAGPTVFVAMSTLLSEDDEPGELAGAGPITAWQARELALQSDASWWNLKLDEQGRMLDMSRTRYRPSAALRRFIETRDQYCRFPHCRRRAVRCEIDHCEAWAGKGGQTCRANLHPLCKRHHRLKHVAGWNVSVRPDGSTEWTSPTGRRYVVPPADIPPDNPGPDSIKPRSRHRWTTDPPEPA